MPKLRHIFPILINVSRHRRSSSLRVFTIGLGWSSCRLACSNMSAHSQFVITDHYSSSTYVAYSNDLMMQKQGYSSGFRYYTTMQSRLTSHRMKHPWGDSGSMQFVGQIRLLSEIRIAAWVSIIIKKDDFPETISSNKYFYECSSNAHLKGSIS